MLMWKLTHLECGEGRAGRLLDSLVGVENPLEKLRHQRLEVLLMGLLDHPVTVPGHKTESRKCVEINNKALFNSLLQKPR